MELPLPRMHSTARNGRTHGTDISHGPTSVLYPTLVVQRGSRRTTPALRHGLVSQAQSNPWGYMKLRISLSTNSMFIAHRLPMPPHPSRVPLFGVAPFAPRRRWGGLLVQWGLEICADRSVTCQGILYWVELLFLLHTYSRESCCDRIVSMDRQTSTNGRSFSSITLLLVFSISALSYDNHPASSVV